MWSGQTTTTNIATAHWSGGVSDEGPGFAAPDTSIFFNGTDEYYTGAAGDLSKEITDAFSVFFWIKSSVVSGAVISKTTGGGNNTGWRLLFLSSTAWFQMQDSLGAQYTAVSSALSTDTWYFVCVSKAAGADRSTVSLYVDGSLDTTYGGATTLTGTSETAGAANIGRNTTGANFLWSGYLATGGVMNRALSSTEISDLYNGGELIDPRSLSWWDDADCDALYLMGSGEGDTGSALVDQVGSNDMSGTNMDSGNISSETPPNEMFAPPPDLSRSVIESDGTITRIGTGPVVGWSGWKWIAAAAVAAVAAATYFLI